MFWLLQILRQSQMRSSIFLPSINNGFDCILINREETKKGSTCDHSSLPCIDVLLRWCQIISHQRLDNRFFVWRTEYLQHVIRFWAIHGHIYLTKMWNIGKIVYTRYFFIFLNNMFSNIHHEKKDSRNLGFRLWFRGARGSEHIKSDGERRVHLVSGL